MLYKQGLLIPNHPNNTGARPLLIGVEDQIRAQLAYIHRGNYGLLSAEELEAAGASADEADRMMRIKRRFAFGRIKAPEEFLDTVVASGESPVEIRNGVTVARVAPNTFRFAYHGKSVDVNLDLPSGARYVAPYTLDFHLTPRERFAVLHSGEGDGWDSDRPCMSSVILWEGKVYLVDAPPNAGEILQRLGIDVSEVAGLFHTHGHDDHFLGLLALTQTDNKLRYFATRSVRAAVEKKFGALLGGGDELLSSFFEVHDLEPDEWNDCDGLAVLPRYSPHPVENTVFLFRALDDAKRPLTYGHWADLSSFSLLDAMAGGGPDQVPPSFIAAVKQAYLARADVKKLDIGGGMIHGQAEDFRHDPSTRLALAHTARELTDAEKEIGSAARFGSLDVLIGSKRDHIGDLADRCLQESLGWVAQNAGDAFSNAYVVTVNPGTTILKHGRALDHLDLLLTGSAEHLVVADGKRRELVMGDLFGVDEFVGGTATVGTYRAISHVRVLRISAGELRSFLSTHNASDDFAAMVRRVARFRSTSITNDRLSLSSCVRLVKVSTELRVVAGAEWCEEPEGDLLCIVDGTLREMGGAHLAGPGDWVGSASKPETRRWIAEGEVEALRIPRAAVLDVPVLHWRLREREAKR